MVKVITDESIIKQFEEAETKSAGVNIVTDENVIKQFEELETQDKGVINAIKKAGISIYDFFDGTKRTEFPEVGEFASSSRVADNTTTGQFSKITLGTGITPLLEEKINVIQSQMPDAQIVKDAYDNPMVILPDGSPLYINKPGASLEDFTTLVSQMIQYVPAAKWATQTGKSLIKKIVQSGVGGGATSVAQDIATMPFGAEGVDVPKAIISTLVPMGFEGVISPAFRFTAKKLFGNPKFTEIVDGQIQLNAKGRRAAKAANIDLSEPKSKQWIDSFGLSLSRNLDENTAAAIAAGDEFGIQFAPPQATGDDMGIAYLFQAADGKLGREAQVIAKDFLTSQDLKMGDITSTVLHKIVTGNTTLKEVGEEFPDLYKSIIERHTKSSENVSTAYNAINKDGVFTGSKSNINLLNLNILKSIDENDMLINGVIDKELYPVAHKAYDIIKNFTNSTKRKDMVVFGNVPITFSNKTYREFDKVYKQLQGLYKSNLSNADKKVLTLVKNEYDKFIDDSLTNGLFTKMDGTNSTTLEIIKNASKTSKEHFDLFGSHKGKSFADRTINKILNDKDMTPEKTLELLFNLNTIGKRGQSLEIVKRLKTVFGVSGDDFGDAAFSGDFMKLREGFVKRMIFNANKKVGNDFRFSSEKFVDDFQKMQVQNPKLLTELFSKKEIQQLGKFVTEVKKTLRPKDLTSSTLVADGIVANIQQTLRGIVGIGGFNFAGIQGLLASKSAFDNVTDYYGKKAALKLVEFTGNTAVVTSPLLKAIRGGPQALNTVQNIQNLQQPVGSEGRTNLLGSIPGVGNTIQMLPEFAMQNNNEQRKNISPEYIQYAKNLGLLD